MHFCISYWTKLFVNAHPQLVELLGILALQQQSLGTQAMPKRVAAATLLSFLGLGTSALQCVTTVCFDLPFSRQAQLR